jgi:tetratricopeptide (TPR) repeat protein
VPSEPNDYWCDLGQTYLKHKNYVEAINSFNQALQTEKEPQHQADILCDLALSHSGLGNKAQAEATLQKAVQLYESLPKKTEAVSFRIADIYGALGKPESAEKIYRQLSQESTSTEVKSTAKKLLINLLIQQGRMDEIKIEEKK